MDYVNQLRPSRTENDSATNPNICQFVSIRGIRGLCGIGVLDDDSTAVNGDSISELMGIAVSLGFSEEITSHALADMSFC